FLEERTNAVEGFELVAADSLELVVRHVPGTRAPLSSQPPWQVLIEATTTDPEAHLETEIEALLAAALDLGIVGDATIASSEAQAQAFWHIRDSISESERAEGQTLAHDISVAVADMPAFIMEAKKQVERRFPGVIASGFGHLGDGNI